MSFSFITYLLPPFPLTNAATTTTTTVKQPPIQSSKLAVSILQNPNRKTPSHLSNHLLSLAIAFVTLTSPPPSIAIPSINNPLPPPNLSSATTPFSQSKNLITGLDNGKIRPCPSNNPGCVSSNPKSSSFAFPWRIPEKALNNPLQVFDLMSIDTFLFMGFSFGLVAKIATNFVFNFWLVKLHLNFSLTLFRAGSW